MARAATLLWVAAHDYVLYLEADAVWGVIWGGAGVSPLCWEIVMQRAHTAGGQSCTSCIGIIDGEGCESYTSYTESKLCNTSDIAGMCLYMGIVHVLHMLHVL